MILICQLLVSRRGDLPAPAEPAGPRATLAVMDGVTGILIKLGARLVAFGLVFYFAARRNPNVSVPNKWATPLIALVFALLNTALYWALKPILNLATLGAAGFVMPFVVNLVLLYATVRV